MKPTRNEAFDLLQQYTENPKLIQHALAVEAAMRAYARASNNLEEDWGIVGLIHDFDYEQNPTEDTHIYAGIKILKELNWPEHWIHAVSSHANYTGIKRDTPLAKTLYAVDELCGFLVACTLVRPSRKIAELPVKSVKKKMKDKAFARAVNRDAIRKGAEELGVELTEHIAFVRDSLIPVADQLGLKG